MSEERIEDLEEKQEHLEAQVESKLIRALNLKDAKEVALLMEDAHPIDLAYALEEASDSNILFLADLLTNEQMATII